MKLNAKKLLLAGTALVAVGFTTQARAANEFAADTNDSGTFTTAAPDERFNTGQTWPQTVNAISSQGKNLQILATGDITVDNGDIIGATANTGTAIVAGADNTDLTLIVNNAAQTQTVTVNGSISKGSFANLDLIINANSGNDGGTPGIFNINGNVDLGTGVLTIDSSSNAGDVVNVNITGNLTASNISVKSDVADGAFLNFTGTTAQTVTGTVQAAVDNDGNLKVANASGVTFASSVGGGANSLDQIFVDNGTSNSSATFKGAVVDATNGIVLGNNAGTDTNTLTFDATTTNIGVTGAISANGATDTNNIVVKGGTGKTVTFNTAMAGSNVDGITIEASTTLNAKSLTATTIDLGSAATLTTSTDAETFTGAINGAGVLDINHNTTIVGDTGKTTALTSASVATGKTLTINASGAARTFATTAGTTLEGTGALALTLGNNVTINGAILANADGDGSITMSAAAGTVALDSDVGTSTKKVNALTFGDAGAIVFNTAKNLYVNTTTLNTDDVLNLTGSSQTVSGAITTGTANTGTINIGSASANANVKVDGVIGAARINAGKVFTGSALTVKNNATFGSGNLVVDGTLTVNTTANAATVSTNIAGNLDFNGTVSVVGTSATTSGDATFTSAGTLTVDGALSTSIAKTGSKTIFGSAVTFGGSADTTITAGNQIQATAAGTTFGAVGKTVTLNLSKSATFDTDTVTVYNAAGQNTTLTGTLNVGIAAGSAALANNETITVIAQAGGQDYTNLASGKVVLVDSGLIDLQDDSSNATTLKVKAVYKTASSVVDGSVAGAAQDLMTNGAAVTGNLATARGNLLAAANSAAAQEVAESLAPTIDGGAMTAALNVTNASLGVTSGRLAALRTGETGMAAGNAGQGLRWWGQVFGQTADQSRRDGVDGFDADTYGVAVGFDTENVLDKATVGLAFSYGDTEVDSDNATRTQTDIDSYQLTLYGDYDLSANSFINAQLAYAWHDVDTTRTNVGGIAGAVANGDYDADQFSARAEYGRDYKYGDAMLTPSALINWSNYDADSYTETGTAGTANLQNVDSDAVNVLELGLAGKASWNFQQADGAVVKPELRAGYRYDLIGDEVQTTASFNGLPATRFTAEGADPARSTFNVGAGVKYFTTDNWEFTANYDFEYKSDYDSHAGLLRAGYKF